MKLEAQNKNTENWQQVFTHKNTLQSIISVKTKSALLREII